MLKANKAIIVYRYISWLLTSLFYIGEASQSSFKYQLAVVIALLVITIVINDLYIKSKSTSSIQSTNMVETIGVAVLLIPTGGLESPFIWYALNPVLAAATFQRSSSSWINLTFYLVAASLISFTIFNPESLSILNLVKSKSNIILEFILISIAVRLLATLIQRLDNQASVLKNQKEELLKINLELEQANASVKRSMEHIMSLYRIVEAFSTKVNTNHILSQMVEITHDIMERKSSFIWLAPFKEQAGSIVTQSMSDKLQKALNQYLNSQFEQIDSGSSQDVIKIEGTSYLLSFVRSSSRLYGYLGIELQGTLAEGQNSLIQDMPNQELLTFLSDLVAVVLERSHLEQISSQLMILEEQNRIGNEIHDNVSQRLFSIVCGLHALNANWVNLERESISRQLRLIEQSAKEVSVELRTSIYRLSTRKRGEKVFRDNIQSYLDDFALLNGVRISFEFQGDEERLPYALKQAIYRIIREGSGNAVRHGQCSELELKVFVHAAVCELMIRDNGQGFDVNSMLNHKEHNGLGLNNMQVLTQTFNGSFELTSEPRKGVLLRIKFPLVHISEELLKGKAGGVA